MQIVISKESIERQTAQNMVEAGIILPDECPLFINLLKAMNERDLIVALLESWQARQQATNPIGFYPVIPEDISPN